MRDNCTNDSGNVTYSPAIGAYVSTYAETAPSVAILKAVAAIRNAALTELDSLCEATGLDGDALDDLFQPTLAGAPRSDGRVEFTYAEYKVRVFAFGRIEIEPLDDDAA